MRHRQSIARPLLRLLSLFSLATLTYASGDGDPPTDPTKAEVPLPTLVSDWHASLVIDNGDVGIWTVKPFPVFDTYAVPELVGLDDRGRCHVMVSYSGKWTPVSRIGEGKWLGGLTHGEVDPRVDGPELYTGGQLGNLYQLTRHGHGALDARLVAQLPGREIHTILSGDLDEREGPELLVFTRPGALFRLRPTGRDGRFELESLGELDGRVRDAVVLPTSRGPARIATVTRAGRLAVLRVRERGLEWRVIHAEPMGMGRISLGRTPAGELVLYATTDDGRVLRCVEHDSARVEDGEGWSVETIYAGPQGLRGVCAGRFDADANVETVATFGYSGRVQILRREREGWTARSIFVDRDKGHWLTACEVDGRNATDELAASGYGGRIVLLSRPPGYGRPGLATDPEPKARPVQRMPEAERVQAVEGIAGAARLVPEAERSWLGTEAVAPAAEGGPAAFAGAERELARTKDRTPRLAIHASDAVATALSPLRYDGGFHAKSMVYETLVRRDETGALAPGLAESWKVEEGGRALNLRLRADARFHDGEPVDAAAVALHFRRWIGLPEHAWLRGGTHVQSIEALGARELRLRFDAPYALVPELTALNPCAIQAPSAIDREGLFRAPCGSGDWRFVEARDGGRRLRLERTSAPSERLELVRVDAPARENALAALRRGEVDGVVGGWQIPLDRDDVAPYANSPAHEVYEGPGSVVLYLSFRLAGPTADRGLRRALRAALDRRRLIDEVEAGGADATTTWAAPSVTSWPASAAVAFEGVGRRADAFEPAAGPSAVRASFATRESEASDVPLTFLVAEQNAKQIAIARALITQWRESGFAVELVLAPADAVDTALESGAYDLRLERTWGVPYDPDLSLSARFASPTATASAARVRDFGVPAALRELVEAAASTPLDVERAALHARVQRAIDEDAWIVPLYTPRRYAVLRAGAGTLGWTHDLYRFEWRPAGGRVAHPARRLAPASRQ